MPTYISLLRYTQQGIKNIKDAPSRLDAAKDAFKKAGADIKAFYLVMGQYDAVVISEAPDDESAAKLALLIGSLGNVQTETLRAFTEVEYRKLVARI
jgi:uncharacterized protein with GYD domain